MSILTDDLSFTITFNKRMDVAKFTNNDVQVKINANYKIDFTYNITYTSNTTLKVQLNVASVLEGTEVATIKFFNWK